MKPLTIAYSSEYLDWQLGAGHPTNPIRAKLGVERLAERDLEFTTVVPTYDEERSRTLASQLHDPAYVDEVLAGRSGEWSGVEPRLAEVASLMFTGSVDLVEQVIADRFAPATYFNPQGAKHHAHFARSSGFCVFNDMAWAAHRFTSLGKKVLYVDWDAHHGDGVEELLVDNPLAVTASIHDGTIFPGTGRNGHDPEKGSYNWALPAGAGDMELLAAIADISMLWHDINPDVVLLSAGADGLAGDPLSTLTYQLGGIFKAAGWIGNLAAAIPVLVGGAGGYQPLTHTPEAWVLTIDALTHR